MEGESVRRVEGYQPGAQPPRHTTVNISPIKKVTIEGAVPLLAEKLPRSHPLADGGGLRFRLVKPGERV